MLIYIAGIIAIPGDLIESAYVDGAGNNAGDQENYFAAFKNHPL